MLVIPDQDGADRLGVCQVFSNPGMSLKEEFAAGSFDGSLLE
jgi:hypothetical protein